MIDTRPRRDAANHDAADHFIDGEDRLSALLRDLPPFEAPATLAASVATAARAVQARMAAEAEASVARVTAPPPTFTAPPTLSDSVLREAARLQQAQAARRDVVFDQIEAGQPAQDVLGAPISNAGQAWLQEQAAQHRDSVSSASSTPPPAKPKLSRWWKSLGMTASAFAVAGLATQIVLRQLDDGTPMTASLSSTVALSDAPPPMAPASSEPAAEMAAKTNAPEDASAVLSAPKKPSNPMARKSAPVPAPQSELAKAALSAPSAPDAREAPVAAPPVSAAAPVALADQAPSVSPPPAPAPAFAQSAPPPAPAPTFAPSAPPPPAALRARRAPQAALSAAAPEVSAMTESKASVASGGAAKSATVTIEDDPASVALQWRPGKALRIWSAEPDNAAVHDWVARLWAAMPAEARPAAPYGIERDDTLGRGQLRIAQPPSQSPSP